MTKKIDLSICSLRNAYLAGDLTPEEVLQTVAEKIEQHADNPIWITILEKNQLQSYLDKLSQAKPEDLPLYGIPFAIKDNIDLAGVPTTAACKEYSYIPEESAYVVQQLIDAGAIPIGKTNLDQFATGLVGTRSPYGEVRNAFNEEYISGGSSSGSAVAVALGQVSFSLGTDTAGSGRIPAAFNNLIGLKPSRGLVSTRGVVPACRSLDCVSLFTLNPDDARDVFNIMNNYDCEDSYARKNELINTPFSNPKRIGVPGDSQLDFFGNDEYRRCYYQFLEKLGQQGLKVVPVDFTPYKKAAELLYQGPWVVERYAAIETFIESHADALNPVTRQIIEPAKDINAVSCFNDQYQLQELKQHADTVLEQVDLICIPTAGTHYRLDEVIAEPVKYNSNLGYYTNFMNLLDYAAVAIPAGFTEQGLPFGVTFFSRVFSDMDLLSVTRQVFSDGLPSCGATECKWQPDKNGEPEENRFIDIAVCGAHLSGMPLNHQLTDRKAVLLEQTRTSDCYRFYALAGGPPYRPGLVMTQSEGRAIEVEVWRMPIEYFGSFMKGIPHPLGIGTVLLQDGRQVKGFICEGYAIGDAEDITAYGNWRDYMATKA